MTTRAIMLASAAVIAAGSAYLSTPQPAAASDFAGCTEEQWQQAAAAANEVCQGASFTVSCTERRVVVTIVACPP